MSKKEPVYCFVAGKSGGHIIPCIKYSEDCMKSNSMAKSIFFASNSVLDKKIIRGGKFAGTVHYLPLYSDFRLNFAKKFFSALGLVYSFFRSLFMKIIVICLFGFIVKFYL